MIDIPARGPVAPKVFYSVKTVALHLIGQGEQPTAKNRLVEVPREGAEGIENAQTIRAMARGPEMYELISKIVRRGGMGVNDFEALRALDHEITG